MSRDMWAQIRTGEFAVTFTLPGSYNPDAFDDMTARLLSTFEKAIAIVTVEAVDLEELPEGVEFVGNDEQPRA